jgi:hypothetical protein
MVNPALPLEFINKLIFQLRLAADIDFPNFPLQICRAKAEQVADEVLYGWYDEQTRTNLVDGLMGK